jgi:transposase-like protein
MERKIPKEFDLSVSQRKFLEAFSVIGTVSGSARAAGIEPSTHSKWMRKSEEYREAYREARVRAADEILETCREVGIRDKNVQMLIHLSKGYFPEMFGINRHEVSGPDGKPIEMAAKRTTDQLLERLRDLQQQFPSSAQTGTTPLLGGSDNGLADTEGTGSEHRVEAVDT